MPTICYLFSAPADYHWLDLILDQLRPFQLAGLIELHSVRQLMAGEDSLAFQNQALQNSDYLLPLLSADLLVDDQLYQNQLLPAIERQEAGQAKLLPILLRECQWQAIPRLSKLKPLPQNGQYLSNKKTWPSTDTALAVLGQELLKIISTTVSSAPLPRKPLAGSTYTDPRDGQNYSVCEWAGQIWMGENLRYASSSGYWPAPEETPEYGAYYTWDAAQAACPPGWRVPTLQDWTVLIDFFGENYLAYKHLLPGGDSQLQFHPAGKWSMFSQKMVLAGACGFYWTGEQENYEEGFYYMFDDGMGSLRRINVDKKTGASVRLIWAG